MVDLIRIQHFSPPPSNITINSYAKIGISFNENDPFFRTQNITQYPQITFQIDNNDITVGKTNIYELTQPIHIGALYFNNEIPSSMIVDIFQYNGEEEE